MEEKQKRNILVTRASLPPFEEYEALIREIWESRWLTNMGRFHEELRMKLKERLKVSGIELFVNGHTALEMALQAFSLKGEVITTPFTFASTAHAITRNGLKPVFCDVREDDATIDAAKIERLITKDTAAIVPVHVYGNICDDREIGRIAKKYNLKVIYDAAHAFLETVRETAPDGSVRERGVGTLGDASMFSFHATKVFNTVEGGAVTWGRKESAFLEDRLYKLKNFGITGKESVEYVGGNGKLNEFSAAMGLCNLNHVTEWIAARKTVTERYRENLKNVPSVKLLPLREHISYNYAYMPVLFAGGKAARDRAYTCLSENGIYPRKYFYPCVNAYECYRGAYDEAETPAAKMFSEAVLTLPLYPELAEMPELLDEICERIAGC